MWQGDSYYDRVVSASIGGSWTYYVYHGLGSTRQLLDANQTVTDSYSYEAFGNLLSDGGETPNPYMYVGSLGYYTTGAPSLLHLGARYYMPQVGRFVTRDPMLSATAPQLLVEGPSAHVLGRSPYPVRMPVLGRHPYLYVADNPVRMVDPAGLGDVYITKKVCEEACAQATCGKKIGLCKVLCKTFKGHSCEGLYSYCMHLLRHGKKTLADVCMLTYDLLCLGDP